MNRDETVKDIATVLDHCCGEYDDKGNHIRNLCRQCEYWSEDNCCCCSYNKKEATALYDANYRRVGEDEIVIKKSELEDKEIDFFLRGRESAFSDMESIYNIQKNDVDYIKTIGQIKQEAKREILKDLNDEGYRIYKQQGDTFDAGNFNWLIAHTMQKHGIERE